MKVYCAQCGAEIERANPDRTISALLTIEMSGCGRTWIMRKWLADTKHSI